MRFFRRCLILKREFFYKLKNIQQCIMISFQVFSLLSAFCIRAFKLYVQYDENPLQLLHASILRRHYSYRNKNTKIVIFELRSAGSC